MRRHGQYKMTILITLGPLLLALLAGYWLDIKSLSEKVIQSSLTWLTYLILGMIGFSIGALENLTTKLLTAGAQALVFFAAISTLAILALWYTGRHFNPDEKSQHTQASADDVKLSFAVFADAIKTLVCVLIGLVIGIFASDSLLHVDTIVTYLLYLLLFLIGRQLHQGNYRLRKLFLNTQGLIIAFTTVSTTLLGGLIGALILDLPISNGLAVVSGFGWYSLSGILITGLGNPVLGTTAFLLDIGREILALLLIPIFCRINSHVSVGYSGATAMDFTLPMLGKFHGANIIPTAIASGFIMSLLVPILIPLFMGM